MKLPPEGARWLVSLRWLACASVFAVIWLTSSRLGIIANPLPLYAVACAMVFYNLVFRLSQEDWTAGEGNAEKREIHLGDGFLERTHSTRPCFGIR